MINIDFVFILLLAIFNTGYVSKHNNKKEDANYC